MRPATVLKGVLQLLTLVVIVASGAYLLIYLYRWEWNRAVISGIFFVSALLVLSTTLVLSALRDIASSLPHTGSASIDASGVRRALHDANAPEPARRFEWLRESTSRTGVFVPVLVGMGLLLSGLAVLVEYAASLFARTTLDRRSARLLTPDLPLGDGPLVMGIRRPRAPARAPVVKPKPIVVVVMVAIASLLAWIAIAAIGDATQTRPESVTAGTTVVDLRIDQRGDRQSPSVVGAALWTACRSTIRPEPELVSIFVTPSGTTRLTLDAALGQGRLRRLFGCFEDATLDLVSARVLSHTVQPA